LIMNEIKDINLRLSAKKGLNGEITVPISKSYAHRVLIACALSDRPTTVNGRLIGEDIKATIDCLSSLGVVFDRKSENKTVIYPLNSIRIDRPVLNVSESGSTLRFMLPLAAALGVSARFKGSERLSKRPISELVDSLKRHGANFDREEIPFSVCGKLVPGDYEINGEISSQYITGLLLSLPILGKESRITVQGNAVSASYLDITLDVLNQFGIFPQKTSDGFIIKGNERYTSPGEISLEADWSGACFYAVAGALSGRIKIFGLNPLSKQGDRIVMDLLKKAGGNVLVENNGIVFSQGKIESLEFSAKNCPDIVPIMSILLARAEGKSIIAETERLRLKESDRLSAILEILRVFGVDAESEDDKLYIIGGQIKGGELPGFNDHRMVMSEAIAVVGTQETVSIWGAQAINKSYPDFFRDFEMLGGTVEEF
jgi:3-phosphoshikimate 1-carboxyvinyltransferase